MSPFRLRIPILTLCLGLLALSLSCTPPQPKETYWNLVVDFAKRAESYVQYDPYTATVHFDEGGIQAEWNRTLLSLRNAGCSASPFAWYPNDYSVARGHFSQPLKFENEAWERDLWRQIQTGRGWGVVQTRYPKAGLQHGDYEVPVAIKLMFQWCAQESYGRGVYHEWVIKGVKPEQTPTAPQKPAAPQPSADATERLKKLKEMFDAGLISKDEYDQKRKAILDQF
jgi:hypothetical protein